MILPVQSEGGFSHDPSEPQSRLPVVADVLNPGLHSTVKLTPVALSLLGLTVPELITKFAALHMFAGMIENCRIGYVFFYLGFFRVEAKM